MVRDSGGSASLLLRALPYFTREVVKALCSCSVWAASSNVAQPLEPFYFRFYLTRC